MHFIFLVLFLLPITAIADIPYEGEGAHIVFSDDFREKAFWREVNVNGIVTDFAGRIVSTPPFVPIPNEISTEMSRDLCLKKWEWERFFPDDRGGGRCLIRKSTADSRFRVRVEQFLNQF